MTRKIHVHGYTCGVLIDALTNPYQRNIVDALNRAAEENHTHLIFLGGRVNSGWENEDRMKYIYTLISPEIVDGLILVSNSLLCDRSVKSAYARTLRPSPAVNIGHVLPGCANIVIDNSSGIRRIVRHLVEEHHAGKIAFIGGVEDNPDAIERHQTFRQTLQELDIPVDPALYYAGDFEQDSGSKAVRHLFAGHADIDTLVVANDHMAIGAMEELRDMGKKVPDDVRITGFDDIPDSCFCIPSLTTAAQPFGRIGRTAIQSMIRQMEKQEVPEKTVMPVEMIVRRSCGCHPQSIIHLRESLPLKKQQTDDRRMAEKIIRSLPPECSRMIAEEMKGIVADLVQALRAPTGEEGAGGRSFLAQWNGLMDRVLIREKPAELLEALLIEISRSTMSGMPMDAAAFRRANVMLQNAWYLLLKKITNLEKSRRHKLERDDILLQYFRCMTVLGDFEEEVNNTMRFYLPRLKIRN